jgi:hypothetical protein
MVAATIRMIFKQPLNISSLMFGVAISHPFNVALIPAIAAKWQCS